MAPNSLKKLFELGKYPEALKLIDEIIKSNENVNDLKEAYFILGHIHHMKGEISGAIKSFQKVVELDPTFTDAAVSLSVILNDIGKYDEAQAIFDLANRHLHSPRPAEEGTVVRSEQEISINHKFGHKHFELAEMYSSYNRFDEALFEFQKAIALMPENLELRVKVAKIYAKKGLVQKAFEELKRLKVEYPQYLGGRVALGVLYYGHGQVIEAQNEWQKVLAINPRHIEATMYLNLSSSAKETQL